MLTGGRPADQWLTPVAGRPLTFRTRGVGRPGDVTLTAFYALPPQRYTIYWDLPPDPSPPQQAGGK